MVFYITDGYLYISVVAAGVFIMTKMKHSESAGLPIQGRSLPSNLHNIENMH